MDNFGDFNNDNLEKTIKKAKRKSLIRNIIIGIITSTLVVVTISFINKQYNSKAVWDKGEKLNEKITASVPNGYVSSENYIMNFFGGKVQYELSKMVGGRPILLESKHEAFGINPPLMAHGTMIKTPERIDGWKTELWQTGYKKMLFFHPEVKYKEYKNDLAKLESIPDDKIVEVAISLDKPYKVDEIADMAFDIRKIKTKWIWMDTYNKSDLSKLQKEIKNNDAKSCGISETKVRGMEYNDENLYTGITILNAMYNSWLDILEESNLQENKDLYEKLIKENKETISNSNILGFVVEGTKEELQVLLNKSYIKSSSFGVIVDPLY